MEEIIENGGVVKAWLVPGDVSRQIVPIGSKNRVFGYDAALSDVVLSNFCAAREQAELSWNGEHVRVTDLGGNGLTLLNGEPVSNVAENLYQNDILSLAGEEFTVLRRDRHLRPELKFNVTFMCEGEMLESAVYKKGEEIHFPPMPAHREESRGLRVLVRWVDSTGASVGNGTMCDANNIYTAVYCDSDEINEDKNNATTMSGKNEVFLCNCDTYLIMRVPTVNLKFGGSKKHNCFFEGIDGLIAELSKGTGELKAYKSGLVSVNGEALAAGQATVIYEMDKISVADRSYSVVGHKRAEPEKIPVLCGANGKDIRLEGLTEGKTVSLGRDYQPMFEKILFIGHKQAQIRKEKGKFYLKDINSKNGTFIIKAGRSEARQLEPYKEVEVENGDIVRLVFIEFTFRAE